MGYPVKLLMCPSSTCWLNPLLCFAEHDSRIMETSSCSKYYGCTTYICTPRSSDCVSVVCVCIYVIYDCICIYVHMDSLGIGGCRYYCIYIRSY